MLMTLPDSMVGKVMEHVGGITHNEGLMEKGRAKREAKGFTEGDKVESMT